MALTMVALVAGSIALFFLLLLLLSVLLRGHVASVSDYKLYELQSGAYSSTASAQGSVQPAKTAVNFPEVEGTVEELKVKEGDTVKKGQLLMTIHSDEIASELSSARSAYQSAQADEDAARSTYNAANAELAAAKAAKEAAAAIAAGNSGGSEGSEEGAEGEAGSGEAPAAEQPALDPSYDQAIEKAQEKVDSAAGTLGSAEDAASSALSRYRSAQGREEQLSVKADVAGTITDLKAQVGANVSDLRGQGAAMQIADKKKLVVVCSVPEADTEAMSRGQEATITGIAADNGTTRGTVAKVATVPNADKAQDGSSCFDVTLSLGTQEGAQAGMNVSATIQLQDFGMVFYVPARAVLDEGDESYVEMVYDDGNTAQHQVQVIATAEDGQKIIRGNALSNGMRIRADLAA